MSNKINLLNSCGAFSHDSSTKPTPSTASLRYFNTLCTLDYSLFTQQMDTLATVYSWHQHKLMVTTFQDNSSTCSLIWLAKKVLNNDTLNTNKKNKPIHTHKKIKPAHPDTLI